MRIGVTGHIRLTGMLVPLIYPSLVRRLRRFRSVHGVTCFAPGADRLFLRAVRAVGGTYEIVLPTPDYLSRQRLTGGARARARTLLKHARPVLRLPRAEPDVAYAAASGELLRRCDHLVALWDGEMRGQPGGTAHTVERAAQLGMPVTIIWPTGVAREPPTWRWMADQLVGQPVGWSCQDQMSSPRSMTSASPSR